VKVVLLLTVLLVSACDSPAPGDPATENATPVTPLAVRYDVYGAAGGNVPPAQTLVNPLGDDANAAEQGKVLFSAMNCDGCHGGGGAGFVGPSLIDGRWRYGDDDGALYHSIFYGRPQGMPAYGGMLSDATVWQLISYVRSQPVPGSVPTMSWQ
jgi:cytochrome c oxidase cbb3-type subunit 3